MSPSQTPESPVVSVKDVTVTFTRGMGRSRTTVTAMRKVSFDIFAGQTLGLVGESGSGKSTTGAVVLGLRAPDSGTSEFEGRPLTTRLRDRAGRVGAVLQHPAWSLDPRRRVIDSVVEPLTVVDRRGGAAAHRARALAMLDDVGLGEMFADRRPHELSGGQRQRVSVARALITNPRFIVFDEAVSALDVSVQAQILNLIVDLQREHGFAALFISHDLGAVRYASHAVGVMQAGSLVELAETKTFYATPTHPYSRQLLQELSE